MAVGAWEGLRSYTPFTSVRSTRRSASTSADVMAAKLSLSPTMIPSTVTVSFTFTMGMMCPSGSAARAPLALGSWCQERRLGTALRVD